ncbi:hypothetical protein Poli38472_007397 [Pythium oligandrum]|uniref:Condensin complex subunit 1 n=1 Tax=Pythium oligandrum TaxID=41045 RepID=A0A8K1FL11_PYTOL|nr:hypothetical protein Poli38472_007397 [Pythium oligandrum]|eukprot:TMW67725.1 hypothetical protein Poli38472_007397 [Pythium oligandrum]
MATRFLVPLHLQDLELAKSDRICVQRVHSFEGLSSDDIVQLLRDTSSRVLHAGEDEGGDRNGLLEEDAFDLCYSVVKKLATLSETVQARALQTFTTFLANSTKTIKTWTARDDEDQVELYRSEFKAIVYFLVVTITTVSKLRSDADKSVVKKKGGASASSKSKIAWVKQFEGALHALGKSMCEETFSLWRMNLPEEEFANLYCRAAMQVMENSGLCRVRVIKSEIYQIIGSAVRRVPSVRISTVSSIVDLIFNQEHLTNTIAELTELIPIKYDYIGFPGDLIREVANVSSGDPSKDTSGTKNISTFLATLSNRSPSLVISNLTFVLGLLESESYQLRNAGVACIAHILLWSFQQQGGVHDETEAEPNTPSTPPPTEDKDAENNSDGSDAEADGASDHENDEATNNVDADLDDSSERSLNQLSRSTRDQLLGVLEDRIHDVNSFARSHTLKMWYMLVENGAVPIGSLMKVMGLAVGRLQDKAAIVRRQSIALLTLLLDKNPFMGNLNKDFHQNKAEEIRKMMEERRAKLIANAEQDMQTAAETTEVNPLEREFDALKRMAQFHLDAIEFIGAFEDGALRLMTQLLGSKSTSDTLEAMNFIRQAHLLKLGGAEAGFKRILPLVWRQDPAIREEVLNVFASLFLRLHHGGYNNTPEESASGLIQLLDECTVAEFTCIEKIVFELHLKRQMPSSVIAALWDFIDESKFPAPVITNALLLLGMLAQADEKVLLSGDNLRVLLANGFGSTAYKDDPSFRLIGAACRLVQHLKFDLPRGKRVNRGQLETLEQLIGVIQRVLTLEYVSNTAEIHDRVRATWFETTQQAIEVLFALCEHPEEVCSDVIKCLFQRVFTAQEESVVVDAFELSHFLFVLGHISIQVAIRVEHMAALIKRLRSQSPMTSDNRAKTGDGQADDTTAMEDELGVAAEVEAEEDTFVHDLIRQDIVCRNLLGTYGPLLVRLLRLGFADNTYDPLVIESAVVALSKFMAVSEDFCEKHLQLVFTLLQESAVPTVRANIVVALGDLAFRFPNLIEPWTSHLYNRLRDVDTSVRKNTAVVLSHLILNDMVKVKGQISEIAVSLVDPSDEIRSLVKLFFHELSRKGNNPIYNILPDTVGQLSVSELVSTEDFDEIVKFLLNYITKDKQIESIVEKMCQRYSAAHPKQRRDFSYCLAYAQHTEKSLRYLHQNRKLFKESLAETTVMNNFKLLISRVRRHQGAGSSAEMKEAIDQLERYIDDDAPAEEEEEGSEVQATPVKPRTPAKKTKSRGRPPKAGGASSGRKSRRARALEDEMDDE